MRDKCSPSPPKSTVTDGSGETDTENGEGSGEGDVTTTEDAVEESNTGKADGEEVMCVRKSLLDSIVLHQARRIKELEGQLEKRKQLIDHLTALQASTQQPHQQQFPNISSLEGLTQVYVGDGARAGSIVGSSDSSNAGPGLLAKDAAARCLSDAAGSPSPAVAAAAAAVSGVGGVGMPGWGVGGFGMGGWGGVGGMFLGMQNGRFGYMGGAMGRGSGSSTGEKKQSRYWTADEHQRFLAAVKTCGPKNYQQIAEIVGTRNAKQVRTHAQKFQKKLEREAAKRKEAAAAAMVAAKSGTVDEANVNVFGLLHNDQRVAADASDSMSPIVRAAHAACSEAHASAASIAAAEAAAAAAAAAAVGAASAKPSVPSSSNEGTNKRMRDFNDGMDEAMLLDNKRAKISEDNGGFDTTSLLKLPSSTDNLAKGEVKEEAALLERECETREKASAPHEGRDLETDTINKGSTTTANIEERSEKQEHEASTYVEDRSLQQDANFSAKNSDQRVTRSRAKQENIEIGPESSKD